MGSAAQKYHELALECLNLAEAAHDPATQDQLLRLARLLRLAERWARGQTGGLRQERGRSPVAQS
jgi:hypothetical protein